MSTLFRTRAAKASMGGVAFGLLGVAMACSSSGTGPGQDAGGNVTPDTGVVATGDGAAIDGSGMACPPQADEWVAQLTTLDVTWVATIATSGTPTTGPVPALYLWTLAHLTIDPATMKFTGTQRTCGTQLIPTYLNATGAMTINAPADAGTVFVLTELPVSKVWDHDMRTSKTGGQLGGWNVGSSISIDPTTSLSGISPTSMYADPTVAWPTTGMSFNAATDFTNDDNNDNNAGITGYPLDDNAMGYYLPRGGLGSSIKLDKLYFVSRTETSQYGKSTSCTEMSGDVTAQLYQSHVIGCHEQGPPAQACTSDEWQFIDSNDTVYSGSAGKGSVITGSFKSKQLMPADASAGPSCEEVVAAFPSPMPQPQGDF